MRDHINDRVLKPNPEYVEIIKRGAKAWNKWRKENPDDYPDLMGANLSGLNLRGIDLSYSRPQYVDFSKADLTGANLLKTDFYHANLSEARLDGANCLEADFDSAILWWSRCWGATFDGANFCGVSMQSADLSYSKCNHANFEYADLQAATFYLSKLNGASFYNARLFHTNFNNADLDNSDFTNSHMGRTIFANNKLNKVSGLETVRHYESTTIGIETLYISEGRIPDLFLSGCGVPDDFISQAQALVTATDVIQFYSCFISYSSKDDEFAKRLSSRMRDDGLRVWFAPEEMKGGHKIYEQIDRAIQVHDRLLIVLSEESLNSEWVKTEIRKARRAELTERRRKLFPISLIPFEVIRGWECFDTDTGKDLGVEIREYFIPDFTNWKDHDAFEQAYRRLLNDLKIEERR